MRVETKGLAKGEHRIKCRECRCVFIFRLKETKRQKVPYAVPAMGTWTRRWVTCPACGEEQPDDGWWDAESR